MVMERMLKYETVEIVLINCEINVILTCFTDCVISSPTRAKHLR